MKIAVAQISPLVGQIEHNMGLHLSLVDLAVRHGVKVIVFPELSLTGYEPSLAIEVARSSDDSCLTQIQQRCDADNIVVGAGLPLRTNSLPHIANVTFRPHASPRIYAKRFLHEDEQQFFQRGTDTDSRIHDDPHVAIAICYELSIPEHAQKAFAAGATVYVASAAKTERGVEEASLRLSALAKEHSAIVMLSNCVGVLDGNQCIGRSSAWGPSGCLLAELNTNSDGLIIVDYEKTEASAVYLSPITPVD